MLRNSMAARCRVRLLSALQMLNPRGRQVDPDVVALNSAAVAVGSHDVVDGDNPSLLVAAGDDFSNWANVHVLKVA